MFDLGFQELVVIFLVALLVFGPKKLPELGRTLGRWVVEIRRTINVAKAQMEDEVGESFKKPDDEIMRSLPKDPSVKEDERHSGTEEKS